MRQGDILINDCEALLVGYNTLHHNSQRSIDPAFFLKSGLALKAAPHGFAWVIAASNR